jgi:cell division GTPase FtsZ
MSEKETTTGTTTVPTVVASTPVEQEKLLRLAVIGTGNCGSMLASSASEELGLDSVAINGSQKDLDLITCPKVVKIVVGDGKGTGKDRDRAKQFFLADSGIVLDNKFIKVIENNDVIVIATSTGGGYGSGSSTELLELLQSMYENKVFIVAGVLPFSDEGSAAFEGTKSWLKEIGALNPTYMIYDNNRFADKMSPNKAAAKVNESFVNDLRVLQGDFISETRTGGIDQRDMLTVLSVAGRIVIDSMEGLEMADIEDGSVIKTLKNHIDTESAHAELVSDKEILASALMYSLGEEFDSVKSAIKNDLQKTFGEHIKDVTNFSDEDEGKIAVVLSGLTEPAMVIDRIINRSKKLEESILSRKAATSKLSKIEESSKLKSVTAKQSFADETSAVNASKDGDASKEDLLKRFMDKKNAGK